MTETQSPVPGVAYISESRYPTSPRKVEIGEKVARACGEPSGFLALGRQSLRCWEIAVSGRRMFLFQ